MMATEATAARPNEAIVTSQPKIAVTVERDSQDVGTEQGLVDGDAASTPLDDIENKHIAEIVDDLVNSAEVSICGGSDNEALKSDISKFRDDEKGHGRAAYGVKKPTSFRSINVNKTFLTTKANAPNPSPKIVDKPSPAASLAATPASSTQGFRPRLVAKTGSALVSKAGSGASGGKGTAPDGNAVWNKNRPAPVPEPTKYTDEELKDKFNIHITERLDPELSKTQNNWADIDDDDEDWAPEAITWKDGTKITIPHTEDQPSAAREPSVVAPNLVNGVLEKPKSPAPGLIPNVKPVAPVAGRTLVLKGAPEKPTLVSKPPAPPTPAKSPWAQLPKIDKVSPAVVDTPTQQIWKSGIKEAALLKSRSPPPPREIAADDFSRNSWRDGSSHEPQKLYNSQSGRYEPVSMDRRARMEAPHPRQPALLQRSSHNDQQGPAEPSAAFQTNRTSDQHHPYGRRRNSSNVSGGSSGFPPRSKGYEPHAHHEQALGRPESFAANSDVPASPVNTALPGSHPETNSHGPSMRSDHKSPRSSETLPQRGSAVMGERPAQSPQSATASPADAQNSAEVQRMYMQKAREAARQRRLDEAAKEEVARQERIRKKLEELGPAPDSKSSKAAFSKDQSAATGLLPSQAREDQSAPRASGSNSQEQAAVDGDKKTPTSSEKDAVSSTERGRAGRDAWRSSRNEAAASLEGSSVQPQVLLPTSDTRTVVTPGPDPGDGRSQQRASSDTHPWPDDSNSSDRYQPTAWTARSGGKSVWGPPNNRSLGNGTFNAGLVPLEPASAMNKSTPGPIAPPGGSRTGTVPQGNVAGSGSSRQGPPGQFTSAPQQEQATGSIAVNERENRQNAWASAVRDGDAEFQKILSFHAESRDARLKAEGLELKDVQPAMKDTWKPVRLDADGRRVEESASIRVKRGAANPWARSSPGSREQQADEVTAAVQGEQSRPSTIGSNPMAPPQSRGSRFFPPSAPRQDGTLSAGSPRPKSPSPPPPDMAGHPAFDGDTTHPHVSLPRSRPVVRLPPAPDEPRRYQVTKFVLGTAPVRGNEAAPALFGPIGSQRNWQSKFDDLLGGQKRLNQPPRGALEAPAVTKESSLSSTSIDDSGATTSRPMAEECFEEQEMGDRPPIRLPKSAPEQLWQPAPVPKMSWNSRLTVHSTTIEHISTHGPGAMITTVQILLPGQTEPKRMTLTKPIYDSLPSPMSEPRTRSNPRRGARGGNNRRASQVQRVGRARDASGTQSYGGLNGPGPNPSTMPRSGRGGVGFRGPATWGRSNAATVQT